MSLDASRHLAFRTLATAVALWAAATAHAASVSLVWDPNSEPDLGGYVVSYGTESGVYTTTVDVGNQTTWSTTSLQSGRRYYFAVQAYNATGLFSPFSNEVSIVTEMLPSPTVTGVSPNTGSVNGGTALTITGTNFRAGAVAIVGAKAALSTVIVSATTINAVAPPGVAGVVDVRVTNLDGQSAALAAAYTYVSNVITVTSVSPVSGSYKGGTGLTIRGNNFAAGAAVFVGGIAATNVRVLGATLLTATAPPHSAGLVDVRVTTPDGRGGTLPNAFTYVNGRPAIGSINPRIGSIRGGTSLTITGANFVDGITVTFGGVPAANVVLVSATTLTMTTPADLAPTPAGMTATASSPHPVDVVVATPDGQSVSWPAGFTYDIVAPSVTGMTPASGPVSGGTTVTVRGAEFADGAVVLFGGTPATGVVRTSSTSLTVVTPAHAAGAVDVLVRNPDGLQGVRQRGFTYVGSNSTVDTDRDGMTDVYEDRFGLDPNDATGDNGAAGDPDGDGRTNLDEFRANSHPRGFVTRYFAEGVTSTFFTTVFALANPGDATAHLLMVFMRADGSLYTHPLVLAPRSRATVDSRAIPAIATAAFSTAIESDGPIVADRTMSWDANGYGAHAEAAIAAPATVWYLAEGATHSGFDLFYLLQNPTAQSAEVQVRYLRPIGAPVVKTYQLGPYSRYNIWVDLEHPSLALTDVSAVVTSTNGVPIIVERSMYLNAGGRAFGAGHNSAGVTTPGTRWFLAEGATGQYFDEFVLIANPENVSAAVRASFMLANGEVVEKQYSVPGNSRFSVWLDFEDPKLANNAVSATIESTNGVPIIVERTMWWPGPTPAQWAESHNSPGATDTATKWGLAEGEQGGAQQRATFILLANTSAYEGSARITLLFEDGTTAVKTFPLLPTSRFNVAVGAEFPQSANRRFGALIESLGDTPAELVVERAMYWNANGQTWASGTNAVATPLD
jgi:hypothetical protein